MKRSPANPALTWLTLVALLVPTAAGISFRTVHAQSSDASLTAAESNRSALSKYAVDLTQLAAILQVSDVNSREVCRMLARNGILLGDSMASLGAVKVDLPARVIEATHSGASAGA